MVDILGHCNSAVDYRSSAGRSKNLRVATIHPGSIHALLVICPYHHGPPHIKYPANVATHKKTTTKDTKRSSFCSSPKRTFRPIQYSFIFSSNAFIRPLPYNGFRASLHPGSVSTCWGEICLKGPYVRALFGNKDR